MILEGGNEQGSLDAGLKDTQDVNSFAKLHLNKAHLYSSRSGVHLPVHKVTVLSNSVRVLRTAVSDPGQGLCPWLLIVPQWSHYSAKSVTFRDI